jgi:Leucine-rich repeat (LRR) protein
MKISYYVPDTIADRIEDCRNSGGEVLDLTSISITKIPDCVREFKNLKKLSICGTRKLFSKLTIPNWIGELTNLEYLYLEGPIETLPESIGNLSALERLELINTEIETLPESFGRLKSLKVFKFEKDYDAIMEKKFKKRKNPFFKEIQYGIIHLPESFGGLSSLEELYISGNVAALPVSFANIGNLEVLNIDKERYCNDGDEKQETPLLLPAAVGQFSKLKSLTLHNAALKPVPDWLGGLSFLRELRIASDTITDLPDSIGNLCLLETLQIDGPSFFALPESIGRLSSLTRLYLYQTKIKTLPETIGNLSKLEKIRLLRCPELESLPDTIGNLRSLKTLYIRGGKMTALPESIGNITSLLGLQLQYTAIKDLPVSIGNLTNLVLLGIYSYPDTMRPWYYESDNPPYYNEDETIEKRGTFTALPASASKLVSLKILNLSNTEITSLPDYLADLPSLNRLEIANCNIETIPPSIQRLADSGKLKLLRRGNELEMDPE